ncbi:MAG: SpoIIE family protein phosphatase, partial [Leptospiraceae bacterium]|nr:SpoIIE family protein phosphatase [Leptospiraceae bacterium]
EILRIIRPVIIESNIIHKSEIIGKLEIVWMNDNIFIHLANGIFFILVYIIILSYIRIVNSKRELSFKNFEISEKMEEVQKLKKQQDGDYYLTSLLTKPLNNLFYTGEGLRVSYYISQKKKFEFKKKLQEIGGDICITDEIVLRGKKYLVFVNADAMGKSLQGAGGVLVFGAAFNSILMRNKNSIITARIYFPELWLKNTFVDIHKIFEAFGGSMLISCIIGLIEEDTNFMYWINAEHPGMILYRDGKANIIDNYNDIFMKLGTEGINNSLKINCFQLYKGDAIVIGSDGKDDLILGKNEFGMNIINDDPELFPKILEKEQGEIENIYEKLKEYGDYSDDFSLLKIEIAEPGFKEISNSEDLIDRYKKIKHLYLDGKIGECEKALLDTLSKYNDSSQILKFLVKIYYESKDFENVCKYIERYIELNPSDSELIFLAAYCFKKIGNFTMGIAFGERYRIRHPDVIRNFVNLAELYYLDKKFDRARKMVQKVLNYDSENEKALKILDLINTKVEKNEM